MYKRLFVFVLFLISVTGSIYATNVELTAHVFQEDTIFNYIFTFNENDSYNKFSLEIPDDAIIDYVVDENGPIDFSIAGNYLILDPNNEKNDDENVFLLKYKTKSISEEIIKTESFRSYQNFNFPVENFKFNVILKKNFGEIISVFPANYTNPDYNSFEWKQKNLEKNSLYIINFKQETPSNQLNNNLTFYITISLMIFIFILVIIGVSFIYIRYLKKYLRKEENKHLKKNAEIQGENDDTSNNEIIENSNVINKAEIIEKDSKKIEKNQELIESKINKNKKIAEIIEKHLTENEKSVVELIKEKEGISQHDILDYLPSLTKSNLSKIISKLHTKRILKRIKVGKINNIYLGEKINPEEVQNKIDEEEEF